MTTMNPKLDYRYKDNGHTILDICHMEFTHEDIGELIKKLKQIMRRTKENYKKYNRQTREANSGRTTGRITSASVRAGAASLRELAGGLTVSVGASTRDSEQIEYRAFIDAAPSAEMLGREGAIPQEAPPF